MKSVQSTASTRRLIFLGPPGAGKGTQAKLLAEHLGISHVASGDLFRYHQRKGTPLGVKALEYMSQGLLVPDEITIAMVLEQILTPVGQIGALLDGFPRNLAQALALEEALVYRGQQIDKVLQIKVPNEEMLKRLNGRLVCRQCEAPYHREKAPPKVPDTCDRCGGELYQRQDDAPEAVSVRIKVYRDETEPLVEHYGRAEKLVEIDGVGTVEEVSQRLLDALKD